MPCTYNEPYLGRCGSIYTGPDGMCEKHSKARCISCKAPATHGCAHAGQFVCGHALCDNCGGATSPQGYHTHAPLPGKGRGRLNIVFSGEQPNLVFVEVEDADKKGIRVGRWIQEGDLTILVIDEVPDAR